MKAVLQFGAGWGSRVARVVMDARLGDPDLDVSCVSQQNGCEVFCGSSYIDICVANEAEDMYLDEIGIDVPRNLNDGGTEVIDGIRVRNAGRFFPEDAPDGMSWFYCKDEFEDWDDISFPFEIGARFDRAKLELVFKWYEDGDGDKHFMFSEVYYDGVKVVDKFNGDLGREGECGCHWRCSPTGRVETVEFR